jgi:hypothetical protein
VSTDTRTAGFDSADGLVAQHERKLGVWQLAVGHVKIGPADPAGVYPNEKLARTRNRSRNPCPTQWVSLPLQQHGRHRVRSLSG